MKQLLLLSLFVSAAFSQTPAAPPQVPAHSVTNGITIDIADIVVNVPYGPAETHAIISVCSASPATSFGFVVDFIGAVAQFNLEAWGASKTESGYCTSVMVPAELKKLTAVEVRHSNSARITAPPPPVQP